MAFEKRYPNRKDSRRVYRSRAKRVSASCRNHGSCKWCLGNRLHARLKGDVAASQALRELATQAAQ